MRKPAELLPELHPFVDALASAPAASSLAEERRLWARFCLANNPPRPPGMVVEEIAIELPGRTLAARLYRGASTRPAPCVLYLHGGGWVLGDLDTQDAIAWGLAEGTGASVLSLAYRLAPEHPYPAAFDDGYETLELLVSAPHRYGIDAHRIALCGDSAGGNLCAAIAIAARDRGGPRVAAQALVYPVLDTDTERPSYLENAEAPILGRDEMIHYLDAYLGPLRAAPPETAMPMRAKDLRALPPAWVHSAECDPLRDEAFVYSQRLRAAGNEVHYRCARGMVHGFVRARTLAPAAAAEFDALTEFLRAALERPV